METALSQARAIAMDVLQSSDFDQSVLIFRLASGLAVHEQTRERGLKLLSVPWMGPIEYEVLAHFHRARALDASGDADGARIEYEWFVNALAEADADLPVQALVDQARTALARIASERG
jgi:hypothetical protein